MIRHDIVREIKETLGLVPSFFKALPESELEIEWQAFKRVEVDEGPIPHKYRHLIGLGLAAADTCRFCVFYHREMAKLFGASDAEIEAALRYVKSCSGWSAYVNGLELDFGQFQDEIRQVCRHIRETEAVKA